jgi:hypothetical protein
VRLALHLRHRQPLQVLVLDLMMRRRIIDEEKSLKTVDC